MPQQKQKADNKAGTSVEIDIKWCKRCGICIEFCPKGVFETEKDGTPTVAYPEKCTMCELCIKLCPDFAISGVEKKD